MLWPQTKYRAFDENNYSAVKNSFNFPFQVTTVTTTAPTTLKTTTTRTPSTFSKGA